MQSGLYGLNISQHSVLFMAQLIPSVIALYGLFYIQESLITIIILQLAYIAVPSVYIKMLSKEQEIQAYFIDEFRGKSTQIRQGVSLCGSAFGMVLLSYIFTYFYEDSIMEYIHIPLQPNILYIGLFMLIFTILNPLLEEIYWRVFINKTYKDSESYRSMTNLSYALFHLILLFKIFNDWEFALGFASYFMSVGRAFEHIRQKYGLITSLMAHYGMTIVSAIAIIGVFEFSENR